MSTIINIFAIPFGFVMRFIFQFTQSYGVSIILFSLLAKLLLMPLTVKQKKSTLKTQKIQPKIKQLEKQYGKDKQKYAEEVQKLYDKEGVSMTSGCGTSLVTLPIMLGLYYVIAKPLTFFMRLTSLEIKALAAHFSYEMTTAFSSEIGLANLIFDKFSEVAHISPNLLAVSYNFLGLNLAAVPDIKQFSALWIIPILSGLTAFGYSFMQQRMTQKATGVEQSAQTKQTNLMMSITMPLMSVYFGFVLPAGIGIYWISNNIFSALSDIIVTKYLQSKEEAQGEGQKSKKGEA